MSERQQILVTGGSGFIGEQLVPALQLAGWQVTVLTRNTKRAAKKLPAETQFIESLPEAASWPFTSVINLAGENLFERRWNEKAKQEFRDSRIELTKQIVSRIRDGAPVSLLVSGSAIGYYGPRDNTPLHENAEPGNDFSAELCIDWEAAARQAESHCAVATVRTGIVLNPDGGAMSQLLTPFKLGLGGRLGDGQQWFSWISRRDMVGLLLFIVEKHQLGDDVSGAWNATAPNPVTNKRFTRAVGEALGRPTVLPMPKFALKAIMGESANLLVTGQRVIPQRAQKAGFSFSDNTIDAAMKHQLS